MRKSKAIICAFIVMLACLFMCCYGSVDASAESTKMNTIRNNRMHEWIDKDTGVHYLIYRESSLGNAGYGGITPRLNADGSIMVTEK